MNTKDFDIHIKAIDFSAAYITGNADMNHYTTNNSHFHDFCEIYINIDGNVSFMVENKLYHVTPGDAIITKPYENHHCIIKQARKHDHCCISFRYEGIEDILSPLFDKSKGDRNFVSLSVANKEKLLKLCEVFSDRNTTIKHYSSFFNIIELLTEGGLSGTSAPLPDDIKTSINYINKNLTAGITVKQLAELSHVTVNTLERHFKTYMGISPYTFVQNTRLAYSALLLEKGENVTTAALDSGFPDYSHYISLFRKRYGKTPLQYKKSAIRK